MQCRHHEIRLYLHDQFQWPKCPKYQIDSPGGPERGKAFAPIQHDQEKQRVIKLEIGLVYFPVSLAFYDQLLVQILTVVRNVGLLSFRL